MAGVLFFTVLGIITAASQMQNLDGIKSKTVGDGQHGTARWATRAEIRSTYVRVPFTPEKWRKQAAQGTQPSDAKNHALPQGIVVGCEGNTTALIDPGDVHVLMIGAAGVGKTAFWLYPCIEYACASGMSFLSTDTKGDVMRNYGNIAAGYGYNVSVIDLRNPTRSHGNNLLHLVNKYMDLYKENPDALLYKAKAEKYAKIIAKTIIQSGMDSGNMGQNAYFYDAAEGLLTATILLVSEFCEPEKRHIVSVYKIIQELLAPAKEKGKNQFQQLMALLPDAHKAKWFAGAALNTSEQAMASVMSTALSRLNAFLDSELEDGSMKIQNMFQKDIDRDINGVIKVSQDDQQSLKQELSEYIITKELRRHFATFFDNYVKAIDSPTDKIGVWISGFFGSGKSHFLKMLSYAMVSQDADGHTGSSIRGEPLLFPEQVPGQAAGQPDLSGGSGYCHCRGI